MEVPFGTGFISSSLLVYQGAGRIGIVFGDRFGALSGVEAEVFLVDLALETPRPLAVPIAQAESNFLSVTGYIFWAHAGGWRSLAWAKRLVREAPVAPRWLMLYFLMYSWPSRAHPFTQVPKPGFLCR